MTSFLVSSSRPLFIAEVPQGVSNVEGLEACQLGTAVRPMPLIIAYDGQDPLEYAQAAAGMGPEGITGDPKLVLWLLTSLSSLSVFQQLLISQANRPMPAIKLSLTLMACVTLQIQIRSCLMYPCLHPSSRRDTTRNAAIIDTPVRVW